MRKILPALLLVCAVALSGCGFNPLSGGVSTNVALAGVSLISYSVLGQSPVDYYLSKKRGKYCDFRNMKKYGEYCIDPQPLLTECSLYCYRTIGVPDCTNLIDPHNNGNQPIVRQLPGCAAATTMTADTRFEILPPPDMPRSAANDPLPLTGADNDLQPDSVKTAVDTRSAVEKGELK